MRDRFATEVLPIHDYGNSIGF